MSKIIIISGKPTLQIHVFNIYWDSTVWQKKMQSMMYSFSSYIPFCTYQYFIILFGEKHYCKGRKWHALCMILGTNKIKFFETLSNTLVGEWINSLCPFSSLLSFSIFILPPSLFVGPSLFCCFLLYITSLILALP